MKIYGTYTGGPANMEFERLYQLYIDSSNYERISIERGITSSDKMIATTIILTHEAVGVGTRKTIELVSENQDEIVVRLVPLHNDGTLLVGGPQSRSVRIETKAA